MAISELGQFIDPLARVLRLTSEINGREYELRVRLPQTYNLTDKTYPVFLALDAEFTFYLAADITAIEPLWAQAPLAAAKLSIPEVILVSVALPSDPPEPFRRNFEFMPEATDEDFGERAARYLNEAKAASGVMALTGGAEIFLRVLSEEILPAVDKAFRVDQSRRLLFGLSASACFASFALLTQPSLFTDYAIVSPGLLGQIFRMEAEWASTHDDLPARVLLTVGQGEIYDALSLVSKVAQFSERLASRNYPSLKLTTWFIDQADHVGTAAPSISRAMKLLGEP
jgi:hypothetical protein